ncbi:MAG: FHA domain-containing protein [Acidobacteria bacterium]|nr:FHA domain-containing protein [Acidobacteriota bacterium]
MIQCQHCGNQNLSSAGFCDECGIRLNGIASQAEPTSAPPGPPSFLREDVQPNPVRPLSPIGKLFLDSEETNEALAGVARLILMIAGGRLGKEFLLTKPEMLIGRWDAARGIFPDVDLDGIDLETKVSRRHARIFQQDTQFFIEDLGSMNGTVINRQHRLQRGRPYMLKDGDEIIVGKTFLKFTLI